MHTVALWAGLAALLAACGEPDESPFPRTGTVTFRYAPHDGTTYVETAFARVSHKSASRVRGWFETELKSEVTIRRSESGYLQTSRRLEGRTWLNGSGYNDPLVAATVGHQLTHHIDPDGKLVAVEGVRDFLLEGIQGHWKRKVADVAGTTHSIGETAETTFPFPLAGGAEISMPQKISALRFVACPAGRCVLVLQDYQSDDAALVPYVHALLRGDPIVFAEGERATPIGCRVTSRSSRVIDPDTMRIYEEDGSDSASFTLRFPDRGEILFERVEEWRRRFEYH